MISQENPSGVWDSNYKGVWHLSEDPSGTIYDSTSYNNDGTTQGGMTSGAQTYGKIDGSLYFDGSDDYLSVSDAVSLDMTSSITLEAWVNGTTREWWNANYIYRRKVTVSSNDFIAVPNGYSVNFTEDTASLISEGKLRSDGNDWRIVYWTGTSWQELDRYVMSGWNTNNTKTWFKTQAPISGGASDNNYYVYYGYAGETQNPPNYWSDSMGADTPSNVFLYGENFEEHANNTDPDGWTDQGTEDFKVILHGSEKWFQATTRNVWNDGSTASNMTNIGEAAWSAEVYFHQNDSNAWGGIGVHIDNGGVGYIVVVRDGGWYRANETWGDAFGWNANSDIHFPLDTKGRIELITRGTSLDAYWYNPSGYSPEKVTLFTNFTIPSGSGKIAAYIERPGAGYLRWIDVDNIFVRNYVSSEPSTSVNSEFNGAVNWWDLNYQYCKELTINAPSAISIPQNYTMPLQFDHSSLVSTGKSQSDGDDIRIVYWTGSSWQELDRILDIDEPNNWNSATTTILFKIQKQINSGNSNNNYYLYYGNPSATNPPTTEANIWRYYNSLDSMPTMSYADSGGSPTWSISSGRLRLIHDNDNTARAMISGSPSLSDFIAYVDLELGDSGSGRAGLVWIEQAGGAGYVSRLKITDDFRIGLIYDNSSYQGQLFEDYETVDFGTVYRLRTRAVGTNLTFGFKTIGASSYFENGSIDSNYSSGVFGFWGEKTENNGHYWDDVRIKLALSTEPSMPLLGLETQNGINKGDAYSLTFNDSNVTSYINDNSISTNIYSGWNHIVLTYNGTDQNLYVNGTLSATSSFAGAINTNANDLLIGTIFSGIIDEIRISNISRSSDWIGTEFNNYDDPNSFYSISNAFTVGNDTIAPDIYINSPSPNDLFGKIAPAFDVNINDSSGIDTMWYRLSNGTVTTINTTFTINTTIEQIRWDEMGNGTVTIQFFANDTVGNENYEEVIVRKDIVDPTIDTINSPSSGAWFNSAPPGYSLTITEANRDKIWYTLDGGVNNYTGALSGTIDSTAWSNTGQGSVTITFYVNDSAGNWDSMSVGINRDTIDPSIDSIDSPSPGAWFNSAPPGYSLIITEANRDKIWYTLDGGVNNYTGALSGTIDSTAWSNAGQGSVTIIFYVNDSAGNWDFMSVDINRDTIDPSIDSIDSPLTGTWFASAPPSYSLSITEANPDEIWYTLDGGVNNYTGASR
jgi:hypothetical protein